MPRTTPFVLAVWTMASLTLLAVPAHAQIGPLGRKLKEKARQAATAQPPSADTPLKFDATLLELTPDAVNHMLAGLQARSKVKGPDGLGAPELRRRATQMEAEIATLNKDRDADRQRYNELVNNSSNCRNEYLEGLRTKQQEEMHRRIMSGGGAGINQQFMMDMQRFTMDVAQKMAAGDTAGALKAQAEYYKLLGIDPHADSAKANAACNVPKPPLWLVRADSVQVEVGKVYERARELERQGSDTAVRVSGFTGEQFAIAAERMLAFVELERSHAARGLWKFSAVEERALTARLAELRALFG